MSVLIGGEYLYAEGRPSSTVFKIKATIRYEWYSFIFLLRQVFNSAEK